MSDRSSAAHDRTHAGWTDFPSLSHYFDRIREALEERKRLGLLSITVLQRRSVENSTGWGAYDSVMREVSAFLVRYRTERMRDSDTLFGPSQSGNAFVLLLTPPRQRRELELSDVRQVRSRVRRALREHLTRHVSSDVFERFGVYVGGSMLHNEERVAPDRIVYRALDEAFADSLRDRERENRRHTIVLQRILKTGLVRAVYQPVVDLHERRIVGYEALTRVPRTLFDPIELLFKAAHDNDAVWTLERLCRKKALENLPPLDKDQLVFLNIEPDSIHDPELRDLTFESLLEGAGLEPTQVVLEVTERSAVKDFAAFRQTLQHVRERGLRLAMDDVGAGYAGLQAIAEIAPDFIKVDINLVRDVHTHRIKRELIATIRRFAASTGIDLVAEGVESPEELESLMEVGVRHAQGFLFARPGAPPGDPDWSLLPRPRTGSDLES
jgi:EAL domain-containing protein (putative c-di-GMP-specific phosphodiesterase class I)/GGDEF domain-containing protein